MKRISFKYAIVATLLVLVSIAIGFWFFKASVKIEKMAGQYKADKVDKSYLVDQSDVQYYKDIEDEYNNRLSFYTPTGSTVPGEENIVPELNEYYFNNYVVRDYLNDNPDYFVDSQNVHDTIVQNNLKNKYKSLSAVNSDEDVVIGEIMNCCNNDKEVFDIIQKIKNRRATLVNFGGDTEMEVLKKTWKNGNQAVQAQIINEIRDCKKGNDIYCPSGTATRIVSATYVENPENYPKDKNSLNKEILEKCAHLRNKNPDITADNLKEGIIQEYKEVHDREFISQVMEPWLAYI